MAVLRETRLSYQLSVASWPSPKRTAGELLRRTINASDRAAVLGMARHRNNGRYNGDGREWETPPELFRLLDQEFDFTLDPCSTDQNAKCPTHFTEADDGLTQPWTGHRVFMNPPYGREI